MCTDNKLNIQTARRQIQTQLSSANAANVLLCHVLQCTTAHIHAYPEQVLSVHEKHKLSEVIHAYQAGKPLAYITGSTEFFSLHFRVTPQVLIPRPETELLVEHLIRLAKPNARILELGTGCGAIAIAAKHARPDLIITATDIEYDALTIAQNNAKRHATHIHFVQSHWFEAIAKTTNGSFEIIVSNPPYVGTNDRGLASSVVENEPEIALFAGKDGLDTLSTIIQDAPQYLSTQGYLIVEHGMTQQIAVKQLMKKTGLFAVQCYADTAGLPRMVSAQIVV